MAGEPDEAIVRNTHGPSDAARLQIGRHKPKREPEVTMFISDPVNTLVLTHEHGRRLRAEAAAGRLRSTSGTRRALAASLRRAADRLDPAPLAWRPALNPPQLGEQR